MKNRFKQGYLDKAVPKETCYNKVDGGGGCANDVSRSGVGGGGPRKVYVNSWRLCFSDFGAGGDARVHFLLLHGHLCVGRTRHEADLTRGRKLLRELI